MKDNMAAEIVKGKGPWVSSAFITTDILSIAIYGGCQGGQGGGYSRSGQSGAGGGMVIAPCVVILFLLHICCWRR
ncbi:hypothetical protein, partial [Corynebacterium diphtheriae]|uniref:hypothetical protein n=1 Tax=Corynebacterium diphtheriae TaxID=1717 RepID=UPI001C6266FA